MGNFATVCKTVCKVKVLKKVYFAPNEVIDVESSGLKMFKYVFKNKTKHLVHVTHLNLLLCNVETQTNNSVSIPIIMMAKVMQTHSLQKFSTTSAKYLKKRKKQPSLVWC